MTTLRHPNETIVQFGGDALIGVLSEPVGSTPRLPTAIVLVNAGLVPKLGPYRMYVQLARRLAADGFTVLRFDLGGLGDSESLHASLPLRERTARELASAADFIAARGFARFITGGLCSGAEDAFRYAEADPRVGGVVMIDPFAYRTAGWRWRHVLYRVQRRALRVTGVYEPIPSSHAGGATAVSYSYMEHAEASRILRALRARAAPVHFLYTGGSHEHFNYPGQLAEMFPGLVGAPLVTLDHFPHMDHTQPFDEDRRAMVAAIAARLRVAHGKSL